MERLRVHYAKFTLAPLNMLEITTRESLIMPEKLPGSALESLIRVKEQMLMKQHRKGMRLYYLTMAEDSLKDP